MNADKNCLPIVQGRDIIDKKGSIQGGHCPSSLICRIGLRTIPPLELKN